MRVLVTWGSKRGGTAEIGRMIARALEQKGYEVVAASADDVEAVDSFDTVIIGGALYANRWPSNVSRFVRRHVPGLRRVPVWFFSSGPLDDSANRGPVPPPRQVAILAERVGVQGHVMFGGRLLPDARGFAASAMAKTQAGDWRDPDRIERWADDLATRIPVATPVEAIDHPGRSINRLLGHGLAAWAVSAVLMFFFTALFESSTATALYVLATPVVFGGIAWNYFRARGARQPLPTAVIWIVIALALDLVLIAGLVQGSLQMFAGFTQTWLPALLGLIAVWGTGTLMQMMPGRGAVPRRTSRSAA